MLHVFLVVCGRLGSHAPQPSYKRTRSQAHRESERLSQKPMFRRARKCRYGIVDWQSTRSSTIEQKLITDANVLPEQLGTLRHGSDELGDVWPFSNFKLHATKIPLHISFAEVPTQKITPNPRTIRGYTQNTPAAHLTILAQRGRIQRQISPGLWRSIFTATSCTTHVVWQKN